MTRQPRSVGKGSPAEQGLELTSGELAALLRVDLKTIHNWVNRGHLAGRRTSGRHLRFDRVQVVRFMRRYGYPVPESLAAVPMRIVVDSPRGPAWGPVRFMRRDAGLAVTSGLFHAALAVARGEQEILVLDLERPLEPVGSFVEAVRASPSAAQLWMIGVSRSRGARQRFLGFGGDAALPLGEERDVRALARWAIGAELERPARAELSAQESGG